MKPSFALNLSHDGIGLLHRAQSGWLSVGDVPLESPNLMDELVVLRRTAADLDAQGLSTKLVIPNSQILYLEVDAPGPSKAERVAQIHEALVEQTPYKPEDLVFDWRANGKTAQVAVVSRETLNEAETFATQYRFNPLSFVAIPPNDGFEGEPFFGPTRHAARFLDGGDTVEPDRRRIKIVGKLGDVVPRYADPEPEGYTNGHANGYTNGHADPNGHAHPAADEPPHGDATDAPPAVDADGMPFQSRRSFNAPEPAEPPQRTARKNIEDLPPPEPARPSEGVPKLSDLPPRGGAKPAGDIPAAEQSSTETAFDAPQSPDDLPPIPPRRGPMPDDIQIPEVGSRIPGGSDADLSPAERAAAVDPDAPELKGRADPILDKARKAAASAGNTSFAQKLSEGTRGLKLSDALARIKSRTFGAEEAAEAPAKPDAGLQKPASPMVRPEPAVKEGKSRLLAKPSAKPLPRPKFAPLPKVNIPPGKPNPTLETKAPEPKPVVTKAPQVSSAEADAMTVFGARGVTPPAERPRFLGPLITGLAVLLLVAAGIAAVYFLNDTVGKWFGVSETTEVTEISEPPPLILPDQAPTGEGAIAGLPEQAGAAETEGDIAGVPPATTDGPGTVPDTDAPPSVPLPGVAVTDLQPDAGAQPPAPSTGDGDAVAAPGAEGALPDALSEDVAAVPPELSVERPSEADLTLALAPPVAPEAPPAPLSALVEDPLSGGPTTDIALNAPPQPDAEPPEGDTVGDLAGLAPAPGALELVPLPQPSGSEEFPQVAIEAPPLARPTDAPPPSAEEANAIYEATGVSVRAPDRINSPGTDRLNEVVLSQSDATLTEPKSRGLPFEEEFAVGALPRSTTPPLPLSYEFDLDERGLVRATEEGALSPSGTTVFSGEPSYVPPPRPVEGEDDARLDTTPDTEVASNDTPVPDRSIEEELGLSESDGGLGAILNDADLAEAEERAQFGGFTQDELAEIRPELRPGAGLDGVEPLSAPDSDTPDTDVETAAVSPTPGGVGLAALGVPVPETDADRDAAATDEDELALLTPDVPGAGEDGAATDVTPDTGLADGGADAEAETPEAEDPLIEFANVLPTLRPDTNASEDEDGADADATPDTNPDGTNPGGTELTALTGETPPPAEVEGATDLAVVASLAPAGRPAGFGAIVEAALQEAVPAPEATPAPPPVSTPDTALIAVPEIPSSAAVASTATEENALRLNQVNLIGVYGSANSRRALVRLSNGRYVKVQVGDTVDRGKVVAISDEALSYVRGGRTFVLELPNG